MAELCGFGALEQKVPWFHICARMRACGISALFAPMLHSLKIVRGVVVIRVSNCWDFPAFQALEQLLQWSQSGRSGFAPVEQLGFAGVRGDA